MIEGAGGVRLSVRSWPVAGRPRGSFILVHGLKDHSSRYDHLAGVLVAYGYSVVSADLRGHGRSAGARQWIGSFSEYVEDLDRVYREVLQDPDHGPVFVLGHSLGGAIVAAWCVDRHAKVSGLVLSAPALSPPPSVSRGAIALTRLLGWLAPHAGILRLSYADFTRDPEMERAMVEDSLIAADPIPARTAAELLRSMARVHRPLRSVQVPILLLHGTADVVTNPAGSAELRSSSSSSGVRLRSYDGLFHDLWHEPEHEVVEGDLVQWLDDQTTNHTPESATGGSPGPGQSPRDGTPGSK